MNIVGGYIEDDIKNYDLMYDHGSFVYEGSSAKFDDKTIIKRTDDTPQSLVYSYNGIQKQHLKFIQMALSQVKMLIFMYLKMDYIMNIR